MSEFPDDYFVSLGGLAEDQLKINATAIAHGYGVRVGVEDNIWWNRDRRQKFTNIQLIERVHMLMKIHQKELFTSKKVKL